MSMMLKHLIFFLLIIKIFSILGQEGFTPNPNGVFNKVDITDPCPCDTTTSCEKGCCCDKNCLNFMLDNSFFDDNFECDPESSSSRIINSKLEYCEDYKKSIDDLYNPLILGFKILKRGFCLFRDNKKQEKEEETNSQDGVSQDDDNINLNEYYNDNFIRVPLALPSGMCLFNSYPIKKVDQDYEVTCTYIINNASNITNNIKEGLKIEENRYEDINIDNCTDCVLKKMEVFFFGEDIKINCYSESKNRTDYQDFTLVIKYYQNESDFHKSGNPGYIKGKPILMGTYDNNYISQFREGIVFHLANNNRIYTVNGSGFDFIYYDNYMDNKLTFEDLIFYQYKTTDDVYKDFIGNFTVLKQKLYFGIFGNANLKYEKDWKLIPDFDLVTTENLLLFGAYMDYGLVNNTQFQIQEFKIQNQGSKENNKGDALKYYFIVKFVKIDIEDKWWYAPGPGFVIRVPKNWMYPFQIGTTTYRTKN